MKMIKYIIAGNLIMFFMISMIYAEDQVMFNYQGRVKVQGQAYNGTGYFKFAIVNNPGNITLWSNDGTSTGGNEPSASISAEVSDGIFNVMIGDASLGMEPLNSSIFNHPDDIKIRIWFDDGSHGFQRLLPDRKIVNPQLLGLSTGGDDFTIYVNSITGIDANNGLTASTAKQTIQSAVDSLPERLFCNVTIDVADGVYREEVKVFGIFVEPGKMLTFLGDETWTPSSPGDPSVRITGKDSDTTTTKVRDYAFMAQQCSNIIVNGFLFDYTDYIGVDLRQGSINLYNSKSANNTSYGFTVDSNCRVGFNGCIAEYNDKNGFHINNNCAVTFIDCEANNNGWSGIVLNQLVNAVFLGTGKFSNNGYISGPSGSTHNGITVNNNSRAAFSTYTGEIKDNKEYGIQIRYDSFTEDHTKNTITGNLSGSTLINNGGHTYF